MLLESASCQLVLIDYQEKLMPAIFENTEVLRNAKNLAKVAKKLRVPVIGTEHWPEKLGSLDVEISTACQQVMVKTHFSACPEGLIDLLDVKPKQSGNARSLPKHIREKQSQNMRNTIVVAGCEAHVCLLQTALDLLNNEWDVWVVTDACGSRTEKNRDAAFDRLAANGAELVTTEMVIYEWLESPEHPDFKFALELIK